MPMIKIALLIDETNGEPLYYKVLNGSIAMCHCLGIYLSI